MALKREADRTRRSVAQRVYWSAAVPFRVNREFALGVAARFRPEKIIVFGSHAYGTPHKDSDVDILVIMPTRNRYDRAYRIRCAVPAPFPMDLLVRTPSEMRRRLADGDLFHTEIVSKGKVLYEGSHSRMAYNGRSRLPRRTKPRAKQAFGMFPLPAKCGKELEGDWKKWG
jgi:predicted nucleotidyltransferase